MSAASIHDLDGPLRLAVVGSPRSGNTWLRGLLANLYTLVEQTGHSPDDVPWDDLPPRCVLQIHWNPTADFLGLVDRHGFRVVSPSRHPLDLLLSALNYAYYSHDPVSCTRPACPTCTILGVSPRSPEFIAYARSDFAGDMLAITRAWWSRPDTIRVRYEDLVADTPAELRRIIQALDAAPVLDPEEVTARLAIDALRSRPDVMHYHYWQGRPGHWRTFLTAEVATRITEAHRETFDALGYACDPHPALDAVQADLNWYRQQLQSARLHLRDEREKHRVTRQELDATRAQLDHVHGILWLEREQRRQAAEDDRGSSRPSGSARHYRPDPYGVAANAR